MHNRKSEGIDAILDLFVNNSVLEREKYSKISKQVCL